MNAQFRWLPRRIHSIYLEQFINQPCNSWSSSGRRNVSKTIYELKWLSIYRDKNWMSRRRSERWKERLQKMDELKEILKKVKMRRMRYFLKLKRNFNVHYKLPIFNFTKRGEFIWKRWNYYFEFTLTFSEHDEIWWN